MLNRFHDYKKGLIIILIPLILGFLTLAPSFNLALTGDDYLGLWRYRYYLEGHTGRQWNHLSFFFTDYGPQDIITATIHKYFGFDSRYYYFFSFLTRVLAALSFFPLVKYLSRSAFFSSYSVALFMVITTGLETTDWSFNMPSYISIVSLNILTLYLLVLRGKRWLWTILLPIFMILPIVIQPIRMIFIPGFVLFYGLVSTLYTWNAKEIYKYLLIILLTIFSVTGLFRYTDIGGSVGGKGLESMRSTYGSIIKFVTDKKFEIFLTPVRQIGNIVIPNSIVSDRLEVIGIKGSVKRVVIPTFVIFAIFYMLVVNVLKLPMWLRILGMLLSSVWTLFAIWNYLVKAQYPLQPQELFGYLTGAYYLVCVALFLFYFRKSRQEFLSLTAGVIILIFSFIIPWLRNPGFLYDTTGRYLVVSGVGLVLSFSICIHTLFARSVLGKKLAIMLMLSFFTLHSNESYSYLERLSRLRGREITDRLRSQIKPVKEFASGSQVLFYFEGDRDVLYHSFIFGFPVIMAFQHNYFTWSNIASVTSWAEVESAYTNGSSMTRFFSNNAKPLPLESIYGYRLDNQNMVDISDEIRSKLKNSYPTPTVGLKKLTGF